MARFEDSFLLPELTRRIGVGIGAIYKTAKASIPLVGSLKNAVEETLRSKSISGTCACSRGYTTKTFYRYYPSGNLGSAKLHTVA
jgi:hypothetical protein